MGFGTLVSPVLSSRPFHVLALIRLLQLAVVDISQLTDTDVRQSNRGNSFGLTAPTAPIVPTASIAGWSCSVKKTALPVGVR